ncbi:MULTISPECIES: magnesium transporter [unclassified Synechococcus]|jgi:magnesium transporter|uniref:magnesium transporter n=1 Tax=unclassified Synechococcus TaxID=2626047 RepID=UPI0018CD3827|nr:MULTISPECIES: magnesium transporter [unclassified Synechococcus]MCT0228393.1 magnesium transporter [Synechococcus sp. CS-1331]QPN71536.1 magnesium transporter [Synechococcus sp. CBW1108]
MGEANGIQVAEVVAQQLESLLEAGNYDGAKLLLGPVQEVDAAEAIGSLPRTLQALAFRLLPKDEAIEVYEYLDAAVQQTLLERLRSGEVLELVEEMSPDDRVRLFDELPAKVVRRLLAELSPAERRITAQLLGYEAETAGRLMTTEFVDLKEFHSAAQALAIVRRRARDTETIYSLYVTDGSRHLTGILSLRDLVTADPEARIGDVMTREVVSVDTDTNQEEVARAIQRYDFLAVPVVDREQRLVGIVTVDDVIDVIEQEATRDLYAAGAVQAGDEDDYFQSNLFTVARRRVVWLLVLLVANSGTSAVIASQELVLKQVVVLAAFIPLLIGTGGNVGAQSSTVVIRGLSTQRLQAMGAWRAIWREAVAGALLGLLMVLAVVPWAAYVAGSWGVATAAGLSLVVITTLAATAGAALPLLFDRLGLDPALMSAPFIATITDVAGVFIYLQLASWLLLRVASPA